MTSFDSWDNELYHHGIKGQKWGIRRYQNEDGSLTAEGAARYRQAEQDAERWSKAQQFYGKGAGVRRRQLRAEMDSRLKDPEYKRMFDEAYARQNKAQHAKEAVHERRSIDRKEKRAKVAKAALKAPKRALNTGIKILGAASTMAGLYMFGKNTGLNDKVAKFTSGIVQNAKLTMRDIRSKVSKSNREEPWEIWQRVTNGKYSGSRR